MQKLELVYTHFLRQFLSVPTTIATKFAYAEFSKLLLKHAWPCLLQASLKYLARLQKMDEQRLCKIALLADMQLGLRWLSGLQDELCQHGV